MKRLFTTVFLVILVCNLVANATSAAGKKPVRSLQLVCAGAMSLPVEEMLATFQNNTGVHMQISYGAANVLLQQLKLRPYGDVFIPADRYYTDQAIKAGIAQEPSLFAYLIPVIMVHKGNPHKIQSLADMTRKDIRVGLVDERIGAIGRLFVALLKKNHIRLSDVHTVYNAPMVCELANAVKLKSIDVAIVWRPIAMSYPKDADFITIPSDRNIVVPVSAGIIKISSNKTDARKFLQFMTSKAGKSILEKYNYPTTDPRK